MEQTAEKSGRSIRARLAVKASGVKSPIALSTQSTTSISLGEESDQQLMRCTQMGDQKAFAILYERYSASVLSYLYRMLGSIEDVESIAQEVFLRAYRFRATYRYPQRLSTWLFTITRNLAINHARRRRRSPVRNLTELNLEGIDMSGDPRRVAAGATVDAEKKEEITRVLTALEKLPEDQKEVILLGIFQDLSYAEMEEITGAKAVTLRSRMFHGLRKLARMLDNSAVSGLPSSSVEGHPSAMAMHDGNHK